MAEKKELKRETWGGKIEFILSTMGYSIGLGNVWRFPYLCYANGGGAFLIPYCVMLAVAAIPVMFLEVSFGQFTSLGCISCWKIAPLFKGLGIAMALVSAYFCMYYNLIIAYTLHYMFSSFSNPLPWVGCNHTWNTDLCYERASVIGLKQTNSTNITIPMTTTAMPMEETTAVDLVTYVVNVTLGNESFMNATMEPVKRVRASEEYWMHYVLDATDGLHDLGHIRWQLLLCFLAAWTLVYLCIIKGVKSSGKVVYFTATFPYLVLFVLLIRGVTLPGSAQGILWFIRPKWKMLGTANVWKSAANQVFISFGAGWGGIHTLASYNKFNNNCYRDVLLVSITCAMTSIFAGFVIFSVIGFMAWDSNLPVDDVVAGGPGLAFVAYPEAVARLFCPQLWSFLFFFMLLTLGLDSQFVTLETLITAVVDEIEMHKSGIRKYKQVITLITCMTMLLLGLPMVTQGGIYVMTLFDWYSAGFSPMLLAFIEVLIISYVYGAKRFMQDIHSMLGFTPCNYWRYCWMAITPIVVSFIIIFSFVDYTPASMGEYIFPPWAEAIGWMLTMTSLITVIVYAIIYLVVVPEGTLLQRLHYSLAPRSDWGPALTENRLAAGYPILPGQSDNDVEGGEKMKEDTKDYIPLASTNDETHNETSDITGKSAHA